MSFVHLHSHSEYSLLDGASRIKEMFARAKQLEMPAVALTDHGVMYGAIPFYLAGKSAGVKPLVGMEAYVAPNSRLDRSTRQEGSYHHLTLISSNLKGYQNLVKLSSLGFIEGYDQRTRRPRLDREILAQYNEGLIVLSGCLSGELAKNVVNGRLPEAMQTARDYKEIFGDRYFLEIQQQGVQGQEMLNVEVRRIGNELGIPLVATNDSHYTCKEDAEAHDILLCIQTGKELSDTKRMKFDTDEFYMKSREEMQKAFPDYQDAVENTVGVAELCDLEIDMYKMLLPTFEVPEGHTIQSYLREQAELGMRRRYQPLTKEVDDRLNMELRVIDEMGFTAYFLIVSDFVQWAKSQKIRVGPGRGSVGGSIVAYCLAITELDPIRWKLGFERFLNPGRKSMPDIDIDLDDRRRGEVIQLRLAEVRRGPGGPDHHLLDHQGQGRHPGRRPGAGHALRHRGPAGQDVPAADPGQRGAVRRLLRQELRVAPAHRPQRRLLLRPGATPGVRDGGRLQAGHRDRPQARGAARASTRCTPPAW